MAGAGIEELQPSHIAGRNAILFVGRNKFFSTAKHNATQQSLDIYTKSNENYHSYKILNANAYSNFICNHQKLDTTQLFLNWWMNKQYVAYIHTMKYHSTTKRNKL